MAVDTYYFDGHDSGGSVFNFLNSSNSLNGNTADYASYDYPNLDGFGGIAEAKGTNAPTTGESITQLRCRFYLQNEAIGTQNYCAIAIQYHWNFGPETVGSLEPTTSSAAWSDWITLDFPEDNASLHTWDSVADQLSFTFISSDLGGVPDVRLYAVEIEVTSSDPSPSTTKLTTNGTNDASYGTEAWTNPENIQNNDPAHANGAIWEGIDGDGTVSNYLKAQGFGFSIPSDATIVGIEATFRIREGSTAGSVNTVKIVKADGSIGSENKSSEITGEGSTLSDISAGNSTDLWSESWSPSDVNDPDFGVVLAVQANWPFGVTYSVTAIWITVYYSGGTPPAPSSSTTIMHHMQISGGII